MSGKRPDGPASTFQSLGRSKTKPKIRLQIQTLTFLKLLKRFGNDFDFYFLSFNVTIKYPQQTGPKMAVMVLSSWNIERNK